MAAGEKIHRHMLIHQMNSFVRFGPLEQGLVNGVAGAVGGVQNPPMRMSAFKPQIKRLGSSPDRSRNVNWTPQSRSSWTRAALRTQQFHRLALAQTRPSFDGVGDVTLKGTSGFWTARCRLGPPLWRRRPDLFWREE